MAYLAPSGETDNPGGIELPGTTPRASSGETAAAFLRQFDPTGWHNVVCFDPDEKQNIVGRTFPPESWDAVAAFVDQWACRRNIYFSVNEPRPGSPDKKLADDDIAQVRAIIADVDLPGANGPAELAERRTALDRHLRETNAPKPSYVIDSGGGYQLGWILPEKLDVAAVPIRKDASRGVAMALDGDKAVIDVSRIMRLPGCRNFPTAKKRAKGRTARPTALLSVGERCPLDALTAAFPPVSGRPASRVVLTAANPTVAGGLASRDADERIAALQAEFETSEAFNVFSEKDWPPLLAGKFLEAVLADPALAALWNGKPPKSDDHSGSAYRAALAGRIGRLGWTAEEYVMLVLAWDFAVQAGDDPAEKLTPRALARDWIHIGLPARRATLADPSKRIRFEAFDDVAQDAYSANAKSLVRGLLDSSAMTVLYGESNSGKSFVALDLAYHIAIGRAWADLPVTAGAVVYIAAEGGRGIAKRAEALRVRFGPAPRLRFLRSTIDLLNPKADLEPLLSALGELDEQPALVIVDTLSRVMAGGEENSSVTMTSLIQNLDRIRETTGCHLLVVHHSGKDRARGARGHSSLRAATDTEIEIAKGEIIVTKQRDIDKAFKAAFALQPVMLGMTEDDEPISSATVQLLGVVDSVAGSSPINPEATSEKRGRIALAVFRAMDGRIEVGSAAIHDRLVEELEARGLIRGKTPKAVLNLISSTLNGNGAETEADGQAVRIIARKSTGAANAPWILSTLRVPKEGSDNLSNMGSFDAFG